MKKTTFLLLMISSIFIYSQTLKDVEVLSQIKGIDIKKVASTLKLKPLPDSQTKLGLTSLFFKKDNFEYTACEDEDNDKADRVFLSEQGKNINDKWLSLCKEFENNKAYKLIDYKYRMGDERESFATLPEIIAHMQKWIILDNKAEVKASFERNNQIYELECDGNRLMFVRIK